MKKWAITLLSAIFATICAAISAAQTPPIVKAESIEYTSAIEDLQKDASFDQSYYPSDVTDYSLKLIQIAESVNRELFVYVYQPSGNAVKASSINISTTINDSISFFNYQLQFLNSSGTILKYKVKDFTVKDEPTRYYAITSLFRFFDENIDERGSGGNTINEVNYAINKQYCFGSINGRPYVNCVDIETIVVTDKFVGYVRYPDGFRLYYGACDSHFVAFNTDKPMDKLLEADVYYTTQKYASAWAPFLGEQEEFNEKGDNYAYLKYTDKVEHNGGGLFAGTYTWDRIQTVEDFIANENRDNIYHGAIIDVRYSTRLTDEALNELQGKSWVLRFTETDYTFWTGENTFGSFATIVGDVTILRLKFETDGITYNLGVIDNKQSGGRNPSNETEIEVELNNNGRLLLILLLIVLLVVLLAPVLPLIIRFIVWVVLLLLRAIVWMIKRIKAKKQSNKE